MKKTVIENSNAPAPIGPYSQAIQVGDFLFVSGQIAINSATGDLVMDTLEQEAHQVMKNIGAILQEAGLGLWKTLSRRLFF